MKDIKVLGPGCAKCDKLMKNVQKAVANSDTECKVEKVTDMLEMSRYGVMMPPALVVDGQVVSTGSAMSVKEVAKYL